jgi:hypothetical protein
MKQTASNRFPRVGTLSHSSSSVNLHGGPVFQKTSCIPSGINNAVARLAGVLAIAALGIVMVKSFSTSLNGSLANLPLDSEAIREIQSKEIELAGLDLPNNLDPNARVAAQTAISEAFLSGFRLVLFSCAGLSIASAAVGQILIPPER